MSKVPLYPFLRLFLLDFVAFFAHTASGYELQKASHLKEKYLETQKNVFLR
jgi:hypothetical protein